MIKKIIQFYANYKKAELEKKKIYLFEKTKEHYLRELNNSPLLSGEGKGEVSIPDFVVQAQLRRLAFALAAKELRKVIAECRVNECYKNCIKYAKKKKKKKKQKALLN